MITKVYFIKTLSYNCVVYTNGIMGKCYEGEDGFFEGVDLYGDNPETDLVNLFSDTSDKNSYNSMYSDDEFEFHIDDFEDITLIAEF